jgi:tetratricopeptide (TPR) repeat protein
VATYLIFGGRPLASAVLTELDRAAEGEGAGLGAEPAESAEPAQPPSWTGPDAQSIALIDQVRGIRAANAGDLGAALTWLEAALAGFERTGDERDAAVVRSNLGFVLAELGDFARAEDALRAVVAAGDRMQIADLTVGALHNLGRVLTRRGRLDEAWAVEQRAMVAYTAQGDPRMAGTARSYLAEIALLAGDLEGAERQARAAAEALRIAPPLRAMALAVLARVLLAEGRVGEAGAAAGEAFSYLADGGPIEEGESLIRLVHVETLAAIAGPSPARPALTDAMAEARARLLDRAAKISDPRWRQQFLTAVPDNERTLALRPAASG